MAKSKSGNLAFFVFMTCLAGAFPANIQINSGAKSVLVGLGSKQVLDCVVQSQGALKFSWKCPRPPCNFTVQNDSNNNTHSFLTIDKVTNEHEGNYTCTFKAAAINTEFSVTLICVTENKTEDQEYFFSNQSVTLKCAISFKRENSVVFQEWRTDNKTLSQLEHHERFQSYENGTLTITKPKRSDAGLYKARFNVTGYSDPYYDCDVIYKAAPLVLDMEKSINIVEDDQFDLICSVKGYPPPDVTWIKDGVTVAQNNSHILLSSYDGIEKAKLSIKSAGFSDEGTYTCNASIAGQSSLKSVVVRVKDRLEWLWPIIGILCEAIMLSLIIFLCSKVKKGHHED